MRNPSYESARSSFVKVVMTKYRALTGYSGSGSSGREVRRKWFVGLLLSVALLGGICLVARARVPSGTDNGNTGSDATAAAKTNVGAGSGDVSAKPASKLRAAAAMPSGGATSKPAKAAKPGAPRKGKAGVVRANSGTAEPAAEQDASTSGVLKPRDEEGQDLILRRAQWFHDQRAYPFAHIPPGAYEKALQQRDAMLQRQRLNNSGILNPQALITFPGDGLWHLMGPQPTNRPFGNISGLGNSGFPTSSGRITAVAVDPSDVTGNTVYVGGAAGGVWKTTDGGNTWTPLTDSQPSLAVGSIAIDPNNNQTIYVGTGEDNFNLDGYYGAGILKSTNGGTTWVQLGAADFSGAKSPGVGGAQIGGIAVQPGNSQIVLAAVTFFDGSDPNSGIWRSTDGGSTWARPTTGAQGSAGTGVVFDPAGSATNTATVYAALGDVFGPSPASNGVWKSTDSGANWTKLSGGLPASNVGRITLGYAAGTTGATATIYAAIADSSTNSSNLLGLFKTTNAGAASPTWSALTGPAGGFCNGQCFYDMAVGVDPRSANNVVLGGGAGPDNFTSLFESKDGGVTWTGTAGDDFSGPVSGTHPHVDTHAIVFTPSTETFRLYVGNDGGLWRTDTPTPSGVSPTWVDGNTGLALTQFYPGVTAAIGDENSGFGGTQDNDTQEFTGTLDWTGVDACGDGGFTAIDHQYPTTIYTTCAPGSGPGLVMKSVFNGAIVGGNPTFSPADTGIASENSLFIPPVAIDDSTIAPNLYYGTCHVFQSTNGGALWTAITGDLPSGTNTLGAPCGGAGSITNFDIGHSNTSVVVAGTSNGKIWETLSAAAGPASTWTEIDNLVPGQLPARHVTAVRTKRSDSTGQIVYATFSGFGSCGGCDGKGHVFKTTNGGATWTNISGDLPDTPVNDIIVDHSSNPAFDALYIATDVGVFSCPNPEATPACANWTVVGDGLPNSPVLGLALRRSSRILHAATHGRSMWQLQLRDEQPPAVASLSSLTPAAVLVGAATTNVTVYGVNFSASTQVLFDGASVGTPTFVSTTQLTVAVNANMFQAGIVYSVTLSDPAGADTGALPFTVMNPILTATNMTPNNTTAGTAVTLVFTGTNFVSSANGASGTQVTFNNIPLFGGTASAGGTSFSVQVPAAFLTTAGPVTVTITNPLPGGGPTPPVSFPFTINPGTIIFNPNPITLFTALNTTSQVLNVAIINTSAASATITAQSITGTNFTNFAFAAPTSGTTCNFPTSGQSGTGSVTLAANGGTCNFGITYFANPASPGNAVSNATLSVTDNASGSPQSVPVQGTPLQAAVVLTPVNFGAVTVGTTSATMNATLENGGSSAVNVTSAFSISGTNAADFHLVPFVPNGDTLSACPAAPFVLPAAPNPGFACDVSLTFTPSIPPASETAQLNVAASVAVTTVTPNLLGIGVEITSISPEIVATGGPAFTLTVNGGGFAPSAVVNVNGSARLTTSVNSGQLKASIPATDIAAAGSLAISVTTPVPGGTTSEPKSLIVAQAVAATNDNVNFAVAIAPASTPFRITQDTTQATTQATAFTGTPATPIDPLPCASGSKAKSVWFTFTPTASGKVVADTRFSSYSTILSAWTISAPLPSSTATFAPVACNTANVPAAGSSPAQSLITFAATSGTTYFLMVTDAGAGTGGTLTFSLDFASAAPTNDDSAVATVISPAALPYSNTVNSISATANTNGHTDPTPPCTVGAAGLVGSGQANSVWYTFTPTSNGTITADTLTSPYITILNVTSGTANGTQVGCNQSASAGIAQSQVSFAATSGTQYFFMVSSFLGDGGTTNFHLTFAATSGPVAALTPSPVPFGNQRVNTTSTAQTATLTNSGTATLTLAASSAVTITGTNASDFAIAAGTTCANGTNVAAGGASCIINVTFKPGATGARTATLNVADNANPSPQSVTLNGTGTAPIATVTPNPLPFGNQRKGTTSAALAVTVKNTGTDTLNLAAANAVVIGGTNGADFANAAGTTCVNSTALAPTASCIVNITFTPSTSAAEAATLTITDDSGAVAGTAQVVNLTGTGTFPLAAATPNPVPFGNVPKGTTSGPMTVTLTNSGTDTLHLAAASAVVFSGPNAGDFASAAGTTCANSVAVAAGGASCIVNVTFTPSTTGAETATLTFTDDASPTTQAVTLTGTGTAASVTLAPSPVPFGNQRINTTSAATAVTLTNSGNASVTLSTPTLSITGTNASDFAVVVAGTTCTNSAVIAASPGPGNTCVIKVTFTPGATGARTATLNVADNAVGSPQSVTLNGTGTVPTASVAPLNIPFGNQRKGTTSAGTDVTVSNTGTDTLNVASIVLGGTNPSQFVLGAPSSGTACSLAVATAVAPAANCKFSVKFAPTATGAQAATVTITDDSGAVAGTQQTVTVSGTGTLPQASAAPNPLAFGNQRKGTSSAAMTVTLTNTGTDTLNLAAANAVAISGANAADFAIVAGTTTCKNSTALPAAPGPGNTCVVNITFTPTTTAAETGTLTFTDDSGGVAGSAQPVSLTGTGVLPQASPGPSPLAFGNQPKGVTSAALTVTLTNTGSDTLNLAAASAVAISGPNAADFAIVAATTTCKNSTALTPTPGPGNTCVANVTFTPSTTAAESASLTFTDDSGGVAGSNQVVSLTGTGITATVNLTPSPVSFANQRNGTTSAATTITLTNSGNAAVHLAAGTPVTLTGTNAGDFAIVAGTTTCISGATIAAAPGPGNTCVINVTFTPGATGARSATVNVADDAPGSPQTDNLNGTGIFPAVSATPSPLAFGNQLVASTSAPLTITVKNVGTDTLNLAASSAVVIGGANAGDFAFAAGTTCTNSAAIAVNGTCVINIQFTPALAGPRAGTATITDDVAPAQVINLTGNGDTPASIAATAGTPQSTTINTAFGTALQATVKDGSGNVLPGVSVTFAAPVAGASGAFTGSATVTTDANGVATAPTFTANSVAGSYLVTATAVGVAAPASFSLTNNAGPPASIAVVSGTPQTVVVGTAFATLKVIVKDGSGNPVANASVTFTATPAGNGASGTFANGTNTATVSTDNTGTASATTFTANFTNGGPYQVNATVAGVASPASFSLTNTANAPTITAPLVPASATAGGGAFVLTVNGTNFATTSIVNFNGIAKTTTFVSGTQLTASIAAADIATAATVNVTVTTPAPGGGTSSAVQFAINNPVPTITTLAPTSATAGGAAFALTVTGTNFVATSVVNFNGAAKVTTFSSATQLSAAITAADIATAGIVNVTVTNGAPGGGTSNPPAQFTINNVQPVLTTLSPTSTLAGSPAFSLTVNGNAGSFVTGAVVTFNGSPKTTTFVNSSQLTANITAADIATAGKVNVIVTNPAPAVGPSAALSFTINNPVPTISAANAAGQNHVAGGAAFTLTVTGTNFVSGTNEASVVTFNGKTETTTFVSGTQITASIPAADVATAGTFNVLVTNPGPGGGPTPTTVPFTIDGYTIAGPGSAVTVAAGVQAVFPVTITPTANGFANAVVFSVTGLPANSSLVPLTVPNVATKTTVNVTINTTARGAAPPTSPLNRPLPPTVRILLLTWICALLAGIYVVMLLRRRPQFRRYAVLVPLALLMVSGVVLAGCATAMKGTPMGTSQLTITATSGTLSQSTQATMTVQ